MCVFFFFRREGGHRSFGLVGGEGRWEKEGGVGGVGVGWGVVWCGVVCLAYAGDMPGICHACMHACTHARTHARMHGVCPAYARDMPRSALLSTSDASDEYRH